MTDCGNVCSYGGEIEKVLGLNRKCGLVVVEVVVGEVEERWCLW